MTNDVTAALQQLVAACTLVNQSTLSPKHREVFCAALDKAVTVLQPNADKEESRDC